MGTLQPKNIPSFDQLNLTKLSILLNKLPDTKRSGNITATHKVDKIAIPNEVTINVNRVNGRSMLFFQTERGNIHFVIPSKVTVSLEKVSLEKQFLKITSLLNTNNYLLLKQIHQSLIGIMRGYKTKLKMVGVGYKAFLEPSRLLKITLGYSHTNYYRLFSDLSVRFSRKNNKFHLRGSSLPAVTGAAAFLHALKKPDVYKGKGVRYRGVPLLRKEGKKTK